MKLGEGKGKESLWSDTASEQRLLFAASQMPPIVCYEERKKTDSGQLLGNERRLTDRPRLDWTVKRMMTSRESPVSLSVQLFQASNSPIKRLEA